MKKIEVITVLDRADKVEEVFKQMELVYAFSTVEVEGEKSAVYSALVPDELVDKAISEISQRINLRLKENMISVFSVEAVVSTFLDRLKEKVAKVAPPPNPLERLVESTERYTRLNTDLLIMTLFATLVALAGLFLDNVAIVIGAMLPSPLLDPINAFAVNASLGRLNKLFRSEVSVLILLAAIISLSAVITFFASFFVTLPTTTVQIAIRDHPTLTDIFIALILGSAAGLAMLVALPEILVGVAIAVALVPPATVSGIGLAFLNRNFFLGAFILTLVYLLGLRLGSTLMLRARKISPTRYYQKAEASQRSAYSILILSILLIVIALIVLLLPAA